jgi:hypothetical protein
MDTPGATGRRSTGSSGSGKESRRWAKIPSRCSRSRAERAMRGGVRSTSCSRSSAFDDRETCRVTQPSRTRAFSRFEQGECSASCLVDGPCASDLAKQDLAAVGAAPLCRLAELLARCADRGFDARPAIRTSVLIPVIFRCAHIARNVTPSCRTLAVAELGGGSAAAQVRIKC